jgi:hypothetical protein
VCSASSVLGSGYAKAPSGISRVAAHLSLATDLLCLDAVIATRSIVGTQDEVIADLIVSCMKLKSISDVKYHSSLEETPALCPLSLEQSLSEHT